jgi:hypothetical protein
MTPALPPCKSKFIGRPPLPTPLKTRHYSQPLIIKAEPHQPKKPEELQLFSPKKVKLHKKELKILAIDKVFRKKRLPYLDSPNTSI